MIVKTSPPTTAYNCIAWAASDDERWWWPDPLFQFYWPPTVSREETLEAFLAAYGTLGYSRCDGDELEPGFIKVAIYIGANGKPTHAARQLPTGRWTSKLGRLEDVDHDSLEEVARLGPNSAYHYGRVAAIVKRRD
jgi:hypothetical protein